MAVHLETSPVKTSMLAYKTSFGVDDWLFIINCSVCIVAVMVLHFWPWLVVACVIHAVLILVTKVSPDILPCYLKHMHQADRYTPFANPQQQRGLRPQGFGREG